MSDVKCPNCGEEQEINHDDGYGYDEGVRHEQTCSNCEYDFRYETVVSLDYKVFCADDHNLEPAGEKWPGLMLCTKCDHAKRHAAPEVSNER